MKQTKLKHAEQAFNESLDNTYQNAYEIIRCLNPKRFYHAFHKTHDAFTGEDINDFVLNIALMHMQDRHLMKKSLWKPEDNVHNQWDYLRNEFKMYAEHIYEDLPDNFTEDDWLGHVEDLGLHAYEVTHTPERTVLSAPPPQLYEAVAREALHNDLDEVANMWWHAAGFIVETCTYNSLMRMIEKGKKVDLRK